MYLAIKKLYNMLKPKINNVIEQKGKIETLEKRIDVLERKLENR